jgi:Family of unknown function (DUF6496)
MVPSRDPLTAAPPRAYLSKKAEGSTTEKEDAMARASARTKSGRRRYGKAAGTKVKAAMRERKRGTLRSGRAGKKVTSRKQAIAIGLSQARKSGAKVPMKMKKR